MNPTDVAIYGAAGYGGQELLRYLAGHPAFRVTAATSSRHAGKTVESVLPGLAGFYPDLTFVTPDTPLDDAVQAVFLATPHGASEAIATRLLTARPDLRVVDLSMDFRPETSGFVYGLVETNRERIRAASRVANPGCFATGALLALAPLYENNALEGPAMLSQTTGSSGSGAVEKPGTHHPERVQDMRAYKVLSHQHEAEIRAEMARFGSKAEGWMVPQSGPFARGIFTVAHATLARDVDVDTLYRARYGAETFVRLRDGTPTLRHVARTNFCDLAVHRRGDRVVVLSTIDNLGKGMAGQAIQNMNLICGFAEDAGLLVPGANA